MTGTHGITQTFDPKALGLQGHSLLLFMDIVEQEIRRHLADKNCNEVEITWRTGLGEVITVTGEAEVEDG